MSNFQSKKLLVPFNFNLCASLKGHNSAVTSISTCSDPSKDEIFVSSSRDSTVLVWKKIGNDLSENYAIPKKVLKGHSHFVSDVKISFNSAYAISSSWDKTLRLWDIETGKSINRFVGHTGEVLSVAFSPLNSRQILSGSADSSIRLWNTLSECKAEFTAAENGGHSDWVTCVRFAPSCNSPTAVSCSRDSIVKVWDMAAFSLRVDFLGHKGYLNSVSVSPDSTLCASGGQDGNAMLWELCSSGGQDGNTLLWEQSDPKFLYSLDAGGIITALAFSPTNYWLSTSSGSTVKIWDLKIKRVIREFLPTDQPSSADCRGSKLTCNVLTWSVDGSFLYAGFSNGEIKIWNIKPMTTEEINQAQKEQAANAETV